MARGGEIACKRTTRNTVRLGKKGSDESDEDYMVGEDEELDESDEEYCSSFDDEESEESLAEFSDEEVEEKLVKNKTKRVGRPGGRNISQRMKDNAVVKRRKKTEAYSEEEERKGMLPHKDGLEVDFSNEKPRKARVSSRVQYVDSCNEKPRKKATVSYLEEKHDSDCAESEDEDDKEFTPDEFDGVDDDEELPAIKKNKMNRLAVRENPIASGRKRKRNVRAVKQTKRKKPIKKGISKKKGRLNQGFPDSHIGLKKRKITKKSQGSRQSRSNSDSDFVSTGSPGYDYTISEEEREQVREAREFCERIASNLTSSSSVKKIEKEETEPAQRKRQGRKGKDKVAGLKIEVGKQVCGICLSEEGKRTIRGVLNCCSHYFCFACIMEWSKVESRCPLCKQRFSTISRTAQADGKHGLRDALVTVPARDQVYQPTEEELRAYLDPYENVLCTECNQGGDDAFMLLCDLCDSPAHTYCVGLGPEVPEGNWYCDGCKPTVLASNGQATYQTPNRGANNSLPVGSSPVGSVRETFDLNELYVPESPSTQATGYSPSTRNSTGDFQDASPASGSGAFTLFERRRIQRQIHQLLNSRARQLGRSGAAPAMGVSLFGSQMYRDRVLMAQHTVPIQQGNNIYSQGILPTYTAHQLYHRQLPSPAVNSLRGQVPQHQASTSTSHSFGGLSHSDVLGTSSRIGQGLGHHHQFLPCNGRPNPGTDTSTLPYQFPEVSSSSLEKERVLSMVRSHLKSLSRNSVLGYITFKHIARTSTHTILAACGLQHRWNQVRAVQTRPLVCDHFDRSATHQTSKLAGQCSSCFDWFVGNIVRERMSTQTPLLPTK